MTDCPSRAGLIARLRNELQPTEHEEIDAHVGECERCDHVMAELCEELALGADLTFDAPLGRDLLFGILALHNSFVSRANIISATSEWLEDKSRRYRDILVHESALSSRECELVEALVAQHLAQDAEDQESSLAGLASYEQIRDDLQNLHDADVDASLDLMRTLDSNPTAVSSRQGSASFAKPTPVYRSEEARFTPLRPHAKGGLGEVFVAFDRQLDRNVALKKMRGPHADNELSRLRFEQEAEVTGSKRETLRRLTYY